MSARLILARSRGYFGLGVSHRELTCPPSRFQCLSTRPTVPRIAEPSIWRAVIPKFLRRDWPASQRNSPEKEWNPATYFIVMFILVGSQALRMVQIKNDHANYIRSTEARIRVLREVIEKLQKGEDVDVRRILGTGDEAAEREWEEVLREIAQEDEPRQSGSRKDEPQAPTKNKSLRDDNSMSSTPSTETTSETGEPQSSKRAARFF
ncbi:hypothetical protein D8B26_008084 [Coccidioides posadasii str. Silveira]|uniref:Uncharacterized protein n=3 Tax=Coccidioides posadasii TaxID=199306 RepID=E9DE05_COCPS|nr:conserved hypothetical protein [Coccidioides posadasii str. Silveira]KMM70210.1 hypothetical protein CPAG_06521 [Coccidioides posadasii RMSCC 3488]QVM13476.1 hypothetical protein D8B26_008084 [Coccidioides posadasii str. Silveira]